MKTKKTIVLGASPKSYRYSYLAVNALTAKGHEVIAVGRKPGAIGKTPILTEIGEVPDVDTITLYLNAENQKPYYEKILALHPKRIIFNPGA
ncbi:MAG: CoA-binding protein, partial [Bacteroidota bacterium]|nr:CoA-binding protein [Bacteroidota bacterium]